MDQSKFALGELAIAVNNGKPVGQCVVTMTPKSELARGANGRFVNAGWYEIRIGSTYFQVQEHRLRKLPEDDGRQVVTWDSCVWRPQKGTKSVLAPKKQVSLYPLPNLTRSAKP